MSESGPPTSGSELPEAVVRDRGGRKRRISPVWIIPIVAAVIGAGLAYRAYQERGIEVTITFQAAEGVTPGKTTVRLRDVDVGLVKDVQVGDDLSHVIVTADLSRHARHHLGEDTQFWVVRPRISSAGVSGLGTLLSGVYIALLPASAPGEPPHAFKGLEEPPAHPDDGGLNLVLRSDALHGLNESSQIYFRDIAVGAVDRYELEKDGDGVQIYATIKADYAHLVHENTRFWNASGIDVSASLSGGFELDIESLRSLLVGGITFDTPGKPGAAAKDGATFELHRHHHASSKGAGIPRGPHFVLEAPRRGSIEVGDSLYYRDEEVGKVVSHGLHDDARSIGIVVAIASRYAPLVRSNTVFWNASGISAGFGLSGLHIHTESLKALLEGGIAFATPDKHGARAAAGSVFELASEEPKDWVKWDPRLPVGSRSGGAAKAEPEEKVHHKQDAKDDPKSHHWFHHLFHGDGGS